MPVEAYAHRRLVFVHVGGLRIVLLVNVGPESDPQPSTSGLGVPLMLPSAPGTSGIIGVGAKGPHEDRGLSPVRQTRASMVTDPCSCIPCYGL